MITIQKFAIAAAASLLSAAALAAPSGGSTSTANVVVTNTAANAVKSEIVASTILPTAELAKGGWATFECHVPTTGSSNVCYANKLVTAPTGKLLRIDEISGDVYGHDSDIRASVRLTVYPPGFVGGMVPSISVPGTTMISGGAGTMNATYFQKHTAVLAKSISGAIAVLTRAPTTGVNKLTLHVFYTIVSEGP